MMMSADVRNAMSFAELRELPNGPEKKFALIKNFRAEIVAVTDRHPREFGCDELVKLIARGAKVIAKGTRS